MRQTPMERWMEAAEAHRVHLMAQQMTAQSTTSTPNGLIEKLQSLMRLQILVHPQAQHVD